MLAFAVEVVRRHSVFLGLDVRCQGLEVDLLHSEELAARPQHKMGIALQGGHRRQDSDARGMPLALVYARSASTWIYSGVLCYFCVYFFAINLC